MNHLSHHLDLLTRQYGFYADVASGSIVVCHMRLSSGVVEGLTDPRSKLLRAYCRALYVGPDPSGFPRVTRLRDKPDKQNHHSIDWGVDWGINIYDFEIWTCP